ncbi:MAG: rod-binding protein [Gemmobacter sp.]|nr:rod-binding protein [Gemmobacter sp.]
MSIKPIPSAPSPAIPPKRQEAMMARAKELEGLFLSEMLGKAGLDAMRGDFGGGIGEEQFASFLRNEQARAIVESGGIGLSEQLFRAMAKAERHGE